MISLHSIMATDLAGRLPMIVGIAAGVLLVVAFIVGFAKGFRSESNVPFSAIMACPENTISVVDSPL